MPLTGIDAYFFEDEAHRDTYLNTVVKLNMEFGFLDYISNRLNETDMLESEINYLLDTYLCCRKNKFSIEDAKRKALIEGMENIYRRPNEKYEILE